MGACTCVVQKAQCLFHEFASKHRLLFLKAAYVWPLYALLLFLQAVRLLCMHGTLMRCRLAQSAGSDREQAVRLTKPCLTSAGTQRLVDGLRGFVTWRHPQVVVSEVTASIDSPVYQV